MARTKKIVDIEAAHNKELLLKQTAIIEHLNKDNEDLKSEIAHLKELLANGTQLINFDVTGLSPEEIIAETQLKLLKEASFNRQLTYEETKRVEIYHKIILNLKNSKKNITREPSIVESDNRSLLKLVDDFDEQNSK